MSTKLTSDDTQFYSELLRVFFDSTNDAIFVLCDEMKFLICNKTTESWLGRSEHDLTEHQKRTPITELLGDICSTDVFETSFMRALENKEVILVTEINPPNAKQRWIELNMQRVDIEDGDMVIAVARDITERKTTEEETQRLQRELNQSHKMEVLGQLTGGIAHDFNNILGIISGYAEMSIEQYKLQNKPIPVKHIENILNASNRAKDLVSQLMVFSRKDNSQSKPLQLAPLIEENLIMLRAIMPSSIEFKTNYQDNIPNVLIDPVKLHQLILNLCINAKDAMNGTGNIGIALGLNKNTYTECASCYKHVEGEWIDLSITDSGSGIAPEVIYQIFDPFFTTKPVGKGTGMGLAVVGNIIETYKGHIVVESIPGNGTTIHLLFPVDSNSNRKQSPEIVESIPENLNSDSRKILIVDDEPQLAILMSEMLSVHGNQCVYETSSTEALARFEKSPEDFKLIITDQTMPQLTGTEMIEKIRLIKPDQKVILATGYSDIIDEKIAKKLNINFILKPVSNNDLLTLTQKILNKIKA